MRKLIMTLFFMSFCFSLIACGKDKEDDSPSVPEVQETPSQEETPVCEHKDLRVGQEVITDCGTTAKFYECSCGYREYITLVGGCDPDFSENEGIDENGNAYMYGEGKCSVCECNFHIKYTINKGENCFATYVIEYTFTQNGETKKYKLEHNYGADHEYGNRQEIDLTQYGICQGTLTTYICEDCEGFCYFDSYDVSDICSTASVEKIDFVDNDGNYHTGKSIKCDVCKFECK